jgi:hypothetical protein
MALAFFLRQPGTEPGRVFFHFPICAKKTLVVSFGRQTQTTQEGPMPWIRLLPIIAQLRPLFPRKVTFFVFVTAIVGMMTRSDRRGVTSIVRALSLKPAFYKGLLTFHIGSHIAQQPRQTIPSQLRFSFSYRVAIDLKCLRRANAFSTRLRYL